MKLPDIANTSVLNCQRYIYCFFCVFFIHWHNCLLLTYHTLEQQLKSSIETEAARLKLNMILVAYPN